MLVIFKGLGFRVEDWLPQAWHLVWMITPCDNGRMAPLVLFGVSLLQFLMRFGTPLATRNAQSLREECGV